MKKMIFLSTLILVMQGLYAQKRDLKDVLYRLENRIIAGDVDALKDMARYLDDTSFVQEFLGYHNYPNSARRIAIRVIEENCLFTNQELQIDSSISAGKFLKLINENHVKYDDLTGMFLITDLSRRSSSYQLKQLSEYDLKRLDTTVIQSPFPGWYYENQVDGFLLNKNPEALKWIASAWYKRRSRFNRYYFNDEEFLDLMKKLTNTDLGVPDETSAMTFLYKHDYYAIARLNYLIYWANHFSDYSWNASKGYFVNTKENGEQKTEEEALFSLLNSENDSVAIDAFSRLTELDTSRVRILSNDYEKNVTGHGNFSLPTFPYRFLKQLTIFTQYCRDQGIDYKVKGWLKDSLEKMEEELEYPDRYRLENDLIDKLTLREVTMVEYFGLIYEEEWNLTYSLGRIIDKFYSRRMDEIITDEQQLKLFLKKAELFDRLGIIGTCNKYLRKFQNCSQENFSRIRQILKTTNDPEIRLGAEKMLRDYSSPIPAVKRQNKPEEMKKFGVIGFKDKYHAALKKCKDEFDCEVKVSELLSKINYSQLGNVMRVVAQDTIYSKAQLLDIIKNDFGIEEDSFERFLKIYDSKSEYDVYEYYFRKNGIGCLDANGNFIYSEVYETLKYDIVDAFVGGGGGRRQHGIYPLIRLLELKFKTTLGFPEKLCDAGSPSMICGPTEMARAWMHYLEEKKLVVHDKSEPPSISD
jgi:hypothetical protein